MTFCSSHHKRERRWKNSQMWRFLLRTRTQSPTNKPWWEDLWSSVVCQPPCWSDSSRCFRDPPLLDFPRESASSRCSSRCSSPGIPSSSSSSRQICSSLPSLLFCRTAPEHQQPPSAAAQPASNLQPAIHVPPPPPLLLPPPPSGSVLLLIVLYLFIHLCDTRSSSSRSCCCVSLRTNPPDSHLQHEPVRLSELPYRFSHLRKKMEAAQVKIISIKYL